MSERERHLRRNLEARLERIAGPGDREMWEARETFSGRAFCFGCDEGRKGKLLRIPRRLGHETLIEIVCEGCKKILDLLRPLTLPFVQTLSHEGSIFWRVALSDYQRHVDELEAYREGDPSDGADSTATVCLRAADEGSADLLVFSLVKCRFKDLLRDGP
jgi:hypothetical protein